MGPSVSLALVNRQIKDRGCRRARGSMAHPVPDDQVIRLVISVPVVSLGDEFLSDVLCRMGWLLRLGFRLEAAFQVGVGRKGGA